MRKFFALLLAAVMACAMLSGCSTNNNTETVKTETEQQSAEKTALTIVTTTKMPKFEAAFEAAYPDIDLQVEVIATGVINGEIDRRLRKGHAPDILITSMPGGTVADYTVDLSAEGFVEKYESTIMKSVEMDGEYHFLPLPGTYYGYILNKTLLDELGLAVPETTDDLLRILAVAKEKGIGVSEDKGYGFGLSDIGAAFLGAYFSADFATDYLAFAEGTKWLNDFNDKKATFTGTWENSVYFVKTCVENGYMDPDKIMSNYNGKLDSDATSFKAEDRMPERQAILTYGNLYMLDKIKSKTEDEIIMIPLLPDTENGYTLVSAVSNNYIAINKSIEEDAVKLSAAKSLLEYLSGEEGQAAWMEDTDCPYSYLHDYKQDLEKLPENIRECVEKSMVFTNPFPSNLLNYLGKCLADVARGKTEIGEALTKLDDYYLNGSGDVEFDLSVVGTVGCDMIYANQNTRKQETEIGNFVADAIREYTGADVALVNGGSIRSSLYEGDVTGSDLDYVCPYGNLVIVSEMDGKTLREAVTNGIQKTWKPAGQFLQVSGIKYSFKPAANEEETAELVSLCRADGTELKDDDIITVAYTNFMGGSSTYVDAGDGYTMLNVYDEATSINVKLVQETGKTFSDIIKVYFKNHADEILSSELEGRIEVIEEQ